MTKDLCNLWDEQLDNIMDFYDIPGISVGVTSEGVKFTGVRGYLDYKEKLPLNKKTVFHCTSISKLFTATGVMKLVEDGEIKLSDCVAEILDYMPIADKRWQSVTIENLMSHTAGLPDVNDYRWELHETSEASLKNYIISEAFGLKSLLYNPNEAFRYSNIGYSILGAVIEEVAGESYESFMHKRIFEPLDMQSSSFLTFKRTEGSFDAETLRRVNFALPHKKATDRSIVPEEIYPYSRRHAPSSTLTSTPEDIIKWAEALMEEKLLDRASLEKMWEPHIDIKGSKEVMCLGWFVEDFDGIELYGHEGGDEGFRTSLWMCPKRKTAAILMCNITDAPLKKLNRKFTRV